MGGKLQNFDRCTIILTLILLLSHPIIKASVLVSMIRRQSSMYSDIEGSIQDLGAIRHETGKDGL